MNWTCNIGMSPDQESNPQLLGAQNNAPTYWATLPKCLVGLEFKKLYCKFILWKFMIHVSMDSSCSLNTKLNFPLLNYFTNTCFASSLSPNRNTHTLTHTTHCHDTHMGHFFVLIESNFIWKKNMQKGEFNNLEYFNRSRTFYQILQFSRH